MDPLGFIFAIVILILSVVAHEVSHGYAAERLGDPTARLAGRLTLNPFAHLDLVGSFIVPVLSSLGGFIIGWAKPVPYNPYNMRDPHWGGAFVAAAGPLTNIAIAVTFGLLVRFSSLFALPDPFIAIAIIIAYINTILAIINLIPLPPIDGSKILSALLPFHLQQKFLQFQDFIYRAGPLGILAILLLIIFVFGNYIFFGILWIVSLIAGLSPIEILGIIQEFL